MHGSQLVNAMFQIEILPSEDQPFGSFIIQAASLFVPSLLSSNSLFGSFIFPYAFCCNQTVGNIHYGNMYLEVGRKHKCLRIQRVLLPYLISRKKLYYRID